jgi:Ca2+-binding RTX toxin-like protein
VVYNAAISGGPKDDTIYCAGYQCSVNGDDGNDKIHVHAFDVENPVHGGSGNDKISFKGGDGILLGDDGNDYILDDGGDGYLNGGNGNDILEASSGRDNTYTGGPGADNFKCSPGPGDVVKDYNPGEGDTVSANCDTVL